jgi:hypothetical protein
MSKSQRMKGKTGEREFLNLLGQSLGLSESLARNLGQSHAGGADCVCIDGLAIEVKRCERLEIADWWAQADRQASSMTPCRVPVLAYRQSRRPWLVVIPVNWMLGTAARAELIGATCTVDLPTFAKLVRLHIDSEVAA